MSDAWEVSFPSSDGVVSPARRRQLRRKQQRRERQAVVPQSRNTTLIAMLVLKDPRCVYCGAALTKESAELDKNDLDGPAITCAGCNDRNRRGGDAHQ